MALVLQTKEVNGETVAVVRDGKPVYKDTDAGDKEVAYDAEGSTQTIKRLNSEAAGQRKAAETATTTLKAFEGIDPEAAKKALETVQNLDDKKLIDAGEVDRVKAAAIAATEDKFKPVVEENSQLKTQLQGAVIDAGVSSSKFLESKVALPTSAVNAMFRNNFELENGKPVAKDANGNRIFSPSNPGEPASVDEALEHLIMNHPDRDSFLKGDNQRGTGAQNKTPGDVPDGHRTVSRADFEKLPADQQMQSQVDGTITVTD